MSDCSHDKALEDSEPDLDDLLSGIMSGDVVWVSGTCPGCHQQVQREYSCVTTMEEE